jgi:hypothetical protein
MRTLIITLLFLGIILMIVGYLENYKDCPLPRIEYRYIPRNFYEEQVSGMNLSNLYSQIFNDPEVWSVYPLGMIENNASLTPAQFKNFIRSS